MGGQVRQCIYNSILGLRQRKLRHLSRSVLVIPYHTYRQIIVSKHNIYYPVPNRLKQKTLSDNMAGTDQIVFKADDELPYLGL